MTRTSLVASSSHRTAPVTRCVVPDNYLLHIPIAGFVGACLGFMINLFFIFSHWCIAKNGGGYTQRGVAKGLKVPCLFMITEVSIRCQKKPGGWYTAYTRVYPPIHHCFQLHYFHIDRICMWYWCNFLNCATNLCCLYCCSL